MPNSESSNLFRGKYRIPSTRLHGWDYTSAGLYFVTICVKDRVPCLAEIVNGETHLSSIGEIVAEEWQKTAEIRANVILDVGVVMPNHAHGIIGITADGVTTFQRVETPRRGVYDDDDDDNGEPIAFETQFVGFDHRSIQIRVYETDLGDGMPGFWMARTFP